MTFDKQLYQLLAKWPGAAYVLCGETPPKGLRYSAPVVKAIERRLDGLIEPSDHSKPRRIVEVQFQNLADIYPRTAAAMALLHQTNVKRQIEAVILFATRKLDPRTKPWSAVIRAVYIDEAIEELRKKDPRHPLVAAFEPVFEKRQSRLAAKARTCYNSIQKSSLPAPAQEACLAIFLSWMTERFKKLSRKEFTMILNLPPISKTRIGRELLAEGRLEGRLEGHCAMALKQAAHKFGHLSSSTIKAIRALKAPELESLGVALLDMKSMKELRAWLELR